MDFKGFGQLGLILVVAAAASGALAPLAGAAEQTQPVQEMSGVGITERLGETLPLDATFVNEAGQTVRLGDYFADGKPVVLNFVYYECPGMCTAVLSGMLATLQQMQWTPGDQFRVLAISFDQSETPETAVAKKQTYLSALNRPGADAGWTFLTGDEANIRAVTGAAGFEYRWVDETGQFAHDMAAIVITPDGRVSRYLRGAFYEPNTLRLALVEASGGKIGTMSERIWTRLCGYDPSQGKYVLLASSVMTIGGAVTVLVVGLGLALLFLREKKRIATTKTKTNGHAQPNPA